MSKIVHITDYFQPQLGYQEAHLASEHAKNHNVTVITSDRFFPFKNYNDNYHSTLGERIVGEKDEQLDGYKIVRIKPRLEFRSFLIFPHIEDRLKDINPEFVIFHNVFSPNVRNVLKSQKRLQFKLTIDNHAALYNTDFNSFFKKFYLDWFKNRIAPQLQEVKLISTGPDEQDFLKRHTGVVSSIIPLGADTDIFKPNQEIKTRIRRELGVQEDEVLLINAGKQNLDKKTDWIVESYNSLKGQYKIKLILIGKLDKELKDLPPDIINLDFVPNNDLHKYFSASDLALYPGSKSNSMIEAISSGLPIILPDEKFAEQYIQNNNGFIVSSKSQFLQKLEQLIKDKDLRGVMGEKSRSLAVEKFSWQELSKKFL